MAASAVGVWVLWCGCEMLGYCAISLLLLIYFVLLRLDGCELWCFLGFAFVSYGLLGFAICLCSDGFSVWLLIWALTGVLDVLLVVCCLCLYLV